MLSLINASDKSNLKLVIIFIEASCRLSPDLNGILSFFDPKIKGLTLFYKETHLRATILIVKMFFIIC